MTPYLFKGAKMFKTINKGLDAVGSIGSFVTDSVNAVGGGANVIKEKISSSVEEEKIKQATERILLKAECVKQIMEALDCNWAEACQVLEEEMNKK